MSSNKSIAYQFQFNQKKKKKSIMFVFEDR